MIRNKADLLAGLKLQQSTVISFPMETKHVTGLPESMSGGGDPSPVTAYGMYLGMKATPKKYTEAIALREKKNCSTSCRSGRNALMDRISFTHLISSLMLVGLINVYNEYQGNYSRKRVLDQNEIFMALF